MVCFDRVINKLIVTMQNICNFLVETTFIFLIFLIATMQISMECETQVREAEYTKHLNLY